MEEKNLDKHFLFDNNEIQNLESKLVELRLNGQTKISQLKDEIDIVKTNKFSDKNQKQDYYNQKLRLYQLALFYDFRYLQLF